MDWIGLHEYYNMETQKFEFNLNVFYMNFYI